MNNKNLLLSTLVWILAAGLLVTVILGLVTHTSPSQPQIDDGIVPIDLDTISLQGSDVEVNFADILLSKHGETRKLIVDEQKATVKITLTDRLIEKIDADFMKKTQTVSYTGTGYFVVDLDQLTKANIIQDKDAKTLTIKIGHAYLEHIAIHPEDVIIDEVQQSLLAWGKIELTVSDFNTIEKELLAEIGKELNTEKNIQKADMLALEMVKAIYEPIVKAIDPRYEVLVTFK